MISYDFIVVGLGAMGSATLYQLAKRGVRVLGIDRFNPPHEMGSSHAETRITRLAVGEGAQYVPLVARSHEIWRELERQTGQRLLYQTGGYIIEAAQPIEPGHWQNFVAHTAAVAAESGIAYHEMTPAAVRKAHPLLKVDDSYRIGYEPTGGIVLSDRAVKIQLQEAQRLGAAVATNEPVERVAIKSGGVEIITAHNRYKANKVALSTGGWIADFVPDLWRPSFRVTRQVVYWFRPEDPAAFAPDRFPFLIWAGEKLNQYFSAFAMPPGGVPGFKCLSEQFIDATTAHTVNRAVSRNEIDRFYEQIVAPRMFGVTPACIKAAVCLYTNTPDDHFVIDHHPDSERVMVVSPCSGHGFKHSAAIGESVAQLLVDGRSNIDLTPFRFRT